MITAKVIADSVSITGVRITTMQLTYPRYIHAELMTHRVFSRNSASSRAIPIKKNLRDVRKNPAIPPHWGANQKGMQASTELQGWRLRCAKAVWTLHRSFSLSAAWCLAALGAHKQLGNRLVEVHNHITVLVTSTKWANFLALRDHAEAEPSMQELARAVMFARSNSTPIRLQEGEWHLPYISPHERATAVHIQDLLDISIARCARLSYFTLDTNQATTLQQDRDLAAKLLRQTPLHASPGEHQATPDPYKGKKERWGNLHGWIQYRKTLPNEAAEDQMYKGNVKHGYTSGKDAEGTSV